MLSGLAREIAKFDGEEMDLAQLSAQSPPYYR